MLEIIIATHGPLAKGLLQTAEMFLGDIKGVSTLSLQPEDSPEDFQIRLKELLLKIDEEKEIVILTDLKGGTPYNQSVLTKSNLKPKKIEVLSGVNVTMLMDGINQQMLGISINKAVESILKEAKDGIFVFEDQASTNTDGDDDF